MNRYTELSQRLNRKPYSTTPDDNVNRSISQIYHAVGATCSTFENLQMIVVSAFGQICTGKQTSDTARLISIIGGVSTFNFKTDMLNQAATVYIHDERKREALNKWVSLAGKAATRRNDIAHGMATIFQNEDQPPKAVLIPPYYDPKKGPFMSNKEMLFRWDAAQIMDYCDAIDRVSGNFLAFIQELVGESSNPEDAWMLDPDQLRA